MTQKAAYIKGEQYLFKNRTVNIEELAEGKYLLTLEKQFSMKAGHVIAITTNKTIEPRIYSLCNGENNEYLQVLFDLHPEGKLTPKLAKLKPGDDIFVSKPYGSFMPVSDRNMWWIATGTGIAPFRAMMRSGYKPELLLHGARQASNFYFEREFKTDLKENYYRCSSGTDGVADYYGRVTSFIDKKSSLPANNKYYLCGRALMVVELRDLLISKGIPYENIISEIFF
ncbi:MAG TPA: oxidoreductase [Prolixibacteraceae bacterium]|nr:oxidoreductase [Prolixibacteraceae bacterium]HPR61267.1 oxidoreductase [Prolixibacteraceae bacterium]